MVAGSIVNSSKKIVGIGYNGFPNGCSDDELPWARKAANELDTKYPCVAPLLVCVCMDERIRASRRNSRFSSSLRDWLKIS